MMSAEHASRLASGPEDRALIPAPTSRTASIRRPAPLARCARLTLVLTLLAAPALAWAEAPVAWRPNRIGGNLGFASAIGLVGLTYERDLVRWFRLEAGAGVGYTGWQLSLMARAVVPFRTNCGFFVGVGPSRSIERHAAQTARTWVNAEFGIHVDDDRLFLQVAAGPAFLVKGDYINVCLHCEHRGQAFNVGDWAPAFRSTVGVRF